METQGPTAEASPTHVARLLSAAAERAGDRPALVEDASGRRLTYAELDDLVDRFVTGLGRSGVRAGQRVMICTGNRVEFVVAYLGTLRARAVAVPVNPRSAVGEIARMVTDCGARLVVADPATEGMVRAGLDELGDASAPGVVVAGGAEWAELVAERGRPVPLPEDPEEIAVLLYTSGTSGRPRGAMLSHRALLANVEQVAAVEPPVFAEGDLVLGVLPLFHVYGLNAVLGQVLHQRSTLLLVDEFEPEACLDLIAAEQVDVVPLAPPVLAYWRTLDGVAERLASVRLLLSGSAPLAAEVIDDYARLLGRPVHQGYGLTEAAPVVTSTLAAADPRSGSVGAVCPGVELALRDPSGGEPSPGDPGEIWIRGDNLFSGYWPDGADGPDADGWWATGDVGYLDAGSLTLVDRLKELVIVSGFNVYPTEVEEVVAEVDGVAAVAVIGLPDEHTGEQVAAYVVPAEGVDRADLVERIRSHAGMRLARFKQPAVVELVEELTVGATGKVQKGRLRAAVRREQQPILEVGQ